MYFVAFIINGSSHNLKNGHVCDLPEEFIGAPFTYRLNPLEKYLQLHKDEAEMDEVEYKGDDHYIDILKVRFDLFESIEEAELAVQNAIFIPEYNVPLR
jgi:hypothetical protein